MGLLIKGIWHDQWYDTNKSKGAFIRENAQFRNFVQNDTGAVFKPEVGRYHLFLSPACPWCHRVMIYLKIKQLDTIISTSFVQPEMLENGWELIMDESTKKILTPDIKYIYHLYQSSDALYSGRATVPILWDKMTHQIVNNESADIIAMLNTEFNHLVGNFVDYAPKCFQKKIKDWNDLIYDRVNNGVYRCGFATTQLAYDKAVNELFDTLDELEYHLETSRYINGNTITESDWRLFPTLVRFDTVYYTHFKTNFKRISEYQHLFNYMLDLYQQPGITETVDWHHIKRHYFFSHDTINPYRIVPIGPEIDYNQPHNRNDMFSKEAK